MQTKMSNGFPQSIPNCAKGIRKDLCLRLFMAVVMKTAFISHIYIDGMEFAMRYRSLYFADCHRVRAGMERTTKICTSTLNTLHAQRHFTCARVRCPLLWGASIFSFVMREFALFGA